jgi:glycosyltransferase involved in cell wall biosynthesis
VKILYLCADTGIDVLGRKGASIHVREMIAAFRRAGHDVDLVAPRLTKVGAEPAAVDARVRRVRVPDDVHLVKERLQATIDHHTPGSSLPKDIRRMLYDQHLISTLHEHYASDPPDVIYVRASLLSTAGVELARTTGRPLVVELNTPLADEQQRYRSGALDALYMSTERVLVRAATAVVVVSDNLAEHVRGYGVDCESIHVLPNAIDQRRFFPSEVVHDGPPVLGFVGNLRAWHGVDVLPELLHRVRLRHPHARMVIAGEGPLLADVERSAVVWGVSDGIEMLGAVDHDDVPGLIRGFTLALAPYPQLAHDFYFSPLKLFEYLGCGVPVVASDVGQIGQIVRSGVHASLVPPGDVAALADACCRLLADPSAASAMGRRGAALVHADHTWDRNASIVTALVAPNALAALG